MSAATPGLATDAVFAAFACCTSDALSYVFAGNAQSTAEQAAVPIAEIALSVIPTALMQPLKLLTL